MGSLIAHTCRICEASFEAEPIRVREMMFGLREHFDYIRCDACECLQIVEIPEDLGRFYPADYYAHQPVPRPGGLRGTLRRLRNRHALRREGVVGALLERLNPYPRAGAHEWFAGPGRRMDARILDVGCGSGDLLQDLHGLGYRHLLGIDAFLEADRSAGGVPIPGAPFPRWRGSSIW